MNIRRKLLIVLGTAAYAPQALFAQTTRQPVLIGWLSSGTRAGYALNLAAFKEGMAGFCWKEGATYALHERWADGLFRGPGHKGRETDGLADRAANDIRFSRQLENGEGNWPHASAGDHGTGDARDQVVRCEVTAFEQIR